MDHQAFAQLLGNYGEFVGAIAVVATLIYLAVQIRHNAAMTKASIRQLRADWAMGNANVFSNSDYLPAISLKIERGEELDEIENRRWLFYSQAWHRYGEVTLLQARDGLVDEVIVDGMREATRRMVATDNALLHDWALRKQTMNPEYQAFMDEILEEVQGA
jgi:hypothetical protein